MNNIRVRTINGEAIWFHHSHCEGKHFIMGNAHTFPGRMLGWCPKKKGSFFFSKNEVTECSPMTSAWIDGFLVGSEPEPPSDASGDRTFKGPLYEAWLTLIEAFHSTGELSNDAQNNEDNAPKTE